MSEAIKQPESGASLPPRIGSETLWQNRMAETLRALKAVESQITTEGMVMRINTDNLFRLICDLELVHNRYIKDIDEAWGEMLKFGNHEGECGFDGECEKCGAKLGRCAKHGEHMALRLNGMTAALNRARQSPNDPTELPPPDSDGGSRKEHPNEL